MRRRVRRPVADTAVYIGNVPKTVRISEFKAKVSFHDAVVQYLSCLTLYVMTKFDKPNSKLKCDLCTK